MIPRPRGAVIPSEYGHTAALLGAFYMIVACLAALLPFLAFGATGLLLLVPTALWLAPGLRTNARHSGNLSDGVVGWPGLTTLVCGAATLAIMGLGARAMAAAWLASLATSGLIELMRAGLAKGVNVRAESRPNVAKRM
jgi:hypothetical protein